MPDVSDALRERGWSQGDYLEGNAVSGVLAKNLDRELEGVGPESILLIVTQDCDIVKDSTFEPFIELFLCRPLPKTDPRCTNGRNPREIHISIDSRAYGISIHDRVRVSKLSFAEVAQEPKYHMEVPGLQQIKRWLSRRYLREAFPDAFNQRLDPNKKKIEQWEKNTASKVSIVLFLLDTYEELGSAHTYGLTVILGFESLPKVSECNDIERQLEQALAVPGVGIADIHSRSESDITIRDLKTFRRWDRDYRSLPGSPSSSPSPQIDLF